MFNEKVNEEKQIKRKKCSNNKKINSFDQFFKSVFDIVLEICGQIMV